MKPLRGIGKLGYPPNDRYNMTQTVIKLRDEEALDIKHLESGLPYKADSKLKGKTYSRFRYLGVIFTVPDTDSFVADFLKGKVYSVTLIEGTRTVIDKDGTEVSTRDIQFDSHISSAQIIGIKTTGAIITGLSSGTISAKEAMKMVDLEEAIG